MFSWKLFKMTVVIWRTMIRSLCDTRDAIFNLSRAAGGSTQIFSWPVEHMALILQKSPFVCQTHEIHCVVPTRSFTPSINSGMKIIGGICHLQEGLFCSCPPQCDSLKLLLLTWCESDVTLCKQATMDEHKSKRLKSAWNHSFWFFAAIPKGDIDLADSLSSCIWSYWSISSTRTAFPLSSPEQAN